MTLWDKVVIIMGRFIENILTSGHTFNDRQNLLKYRVRLFNQIDIFAIIFLLLASMKNYYVLGNIILIQVFIEIFYASLIFFFILLLRKDLKYYTFVMRTQMLLSLVVLASARLNLPDDQLVIIWFYLAQLITFAIGSNRFGWTYTFLSIIINVTIFEYQSLDNGHLTIGTYILSTILIALVASRSNSKIESVERILTHQNSELDKKVHKKTKEIKSLLKEIELTQKEVVFTMGAIGERRSHETGNHVRRVAEYSKLLAMKYGIDEKKAELLKQASPMHDIGKVAIPDDILNKPGKLTEDERKIIEQHAKFGYDILNHSERELLQIASIVAYEHHEKWDGSGYPRGLKKEQIHIYGRITALADVFDALGSSRVYKKAWEDEAIFSFFENQRGKHFDPKLVDIFFASLDEILFIRDKFKDV